MFPRTAHTTWDKICGRMRVMDEVLMEYGVVTVLNGTSLYNAMVSAKPPPLVKRRSVNHWYGAQVGPVQVVADSTLNLYGSRHRGAGVETQLSQMIDMPHRSSLRVKVALGATGKGIAQEI